MQLFGYVRATAKGDADVILRTPEGRPIYAVRNAGAGKGASWMSDLSGEWSRTWYASEQGKRMIQKMIHGLLPQTLSAVDESKTQTRPSEYDLLDRPDGGALLMEMCARTGGTVFSSWADAQAVELPPGAQPIDPTLPLSMLAMACLLADILLRRTKAMRR